MIPLLALAAHAAQPCPAPGPALDDAFAALETLDLERVERRLTETRQALACGDPASPALLGRYWLVSGVWHAFSGRPDEARDAFVATRRMDSSLRVDAFGEQVLSLWSSAGSPAGEGTVTVAQPLDRRESLRVNGAPADFPATLQPGVHLLQVLRFGKGVWADEVYVAPDVTLTVEVVRPPMAELPKRWSDSPVVAIGADVALGAHLEVMADGELWEQPPTRVSVPLELGWHFQTVAAFVRPAALVAPLATAPHLFAGEVEPVRFPLSFGAGIEGGARIQEQGRLGVLAQLAYPGQARFRAVGAWALPGQAAAFELEGRVGANLVTEGAPEPAFSLALVWIPRG